MVRKESIPTSPSDIITEVVRGLDLTPEQLRLAHWRKLPALPTPDTVPFDLESCYERLSRCRRVDYSSADWSPAKLRWGMSDEEAIFWISAAGRWCKSQESAPQIANHVRKQNLPTSADLVWIRAQFTDRQRELPAELAIPLAQILGPVPLLELLLEGLFVATTGTHSWYQRHDLALFRGFWEFVLPYRDSAEFDSLREQLRPKLEPSTWPKSSYDNTPRHYFLAALLGMSQAIEDLVRTWPKLGPKDPKPWNILGHQPLLVLFGLNSPQQLESVARNIGATISNLFDLRGWLANTEIGALDFASNTLMQKDSACNGALTEELCRVPDPSVAPHILTLRLNGAFPATAREWLTRNVGSAVAGLIPVAAGRGRPAEAAVDYLRDLTKTGFGGVLERELPLASSEVANKVRRLVLERPERISEALTVEHEPDWLRTALANATDSRATMPGWVHPSALSPILIEGRRLPDEKVLLLLRELKGLPSDATPVLASTLAAGADSGSCDQFAAELFNRWIAEKNSATDGWVLTAVAWLGGDTTVGAVVPKLRRWPGGITSKRIKEALKAIRRIGTPYAVAQLASLAAKGNNRLRAYASTELTGVATERKLNLEQLADRTIPKLGLDDPTSNECVLDYGPRRFRAVIAPDLRLLARDERGKTFLVLPTPRKSDDLVKVAEARTAWKLAKKQFDLVMTGVCQRMQQALLDQRRWVADEFATHIVQHPIAGAVSRRLLWARFDPATRKVVECFRVTEEGEFVDVDDRQLPEHIGPIGLVHPAHLSEAERLAWSTRLGDYEIIPPFPQLARLAIQLTDEERESNEFKRFNAKNLSRYNIPNSHRWIGESHGMARHFYSAGIKAVARLQGHHPMELLGVSFRSISTPNRNDPPPSPIQLGCVDPVILSEALAEVQSWTTATA